MRGFPVEGLDALTALMARVCDDPYDPVYSSPAGEGRRVADLGDSGFIVFEVDDVHRLVRVYDLVWTG
jgi:hypothetical protein